MKVIIPGTKWKDISDYIEALEAGNQELKDELQKWQDEDHVQKGVGDGNNLHKGSGEA